MAFPRLAVLALLVLASGCATGTVSLSPTAGPSPSGETVDFLPAGCAQLSLLRPDGSPVDLRGRWTLEGDVRSLPGGAPWEMEWIRQEGDCLWGVILPEVGSTADILVWNGHIGTDFVIHRSIILVTSNDPSTLAHADVVTRLTFTSGGVPVLCGVRSPGCPDQIGADDFVERPAPLVD